MTVDSATVEAILTPILSYLISLAANFRSEEILTHKQKRLEEQAQKEDTLRLALASTRTIREELRAACTDLVGKRAELTLSKPAEFLRHMEERAGIVIKSGSISQEEAQPVWEFRHLTFQEYLAARALVDGRYPDRDKTLSLAQQVAPLA